MAVHYTRYPMNSPVGRIVSAILLVFAILLCAAGLAYSGEFDRKVDSGALVEVQATVQSITVTGKGEDRCHEVRVCYSFGGRDYENVPLSWYTSEMEEGQPTTIYVSPDAPDVPDTNSARLFRFVFYVFPAVALLCFAIAWFPRKKKE